MFRNTNRLLMTAILLAACASGSETTTSGDGSTTSETPTASTAAPTTAPPTTTGPSPFPLTVTAANGEVTIEEEPDAIVSLSATSTEMLFAVGAGDQVVAVDSLSNYPSEAPITDLSAFTPNTEAVASYAPDLVIISFDANDLLAGLSELGIPTLMLPAAATLDDVWSQFELLGAVTGQDQEASSSIAELQDEIDAIVADTQIPGGLSYYYELDPTAFFSVTSQTFVGSVIGLLGLENIADAADPEGAAFGYPQLTAEFIISADPDFIVLADTVCCDQNAASVAARPGWGEMKAVTTGAVVELNDDVASRWGPRIVELLSEVAAKVTELAPLG